MVSRNFHDQPMNILSVPDIDPKIEKLPKRFGYFITFSNGLILSRGPRKQYHVINPFTRKSVPLPPEPTCSEDKYSKLVGFMCEKSTDELRSNYIVVRICDNQYKVKHNIMRIATYCSRIGKWAGSELLATGTSQIDHLCRLSIDHQAPPFVAKGAFHWLISSSLIAVYDPGEKNHLQLIELPEIVNYPTYYKCVVTRSSEGVMMYINIGEWGALKMWRLDKGDNGSYCRPTTIRKKEWVRMHEVDSLHKELKRMNVSRFAVEGFVSSDPCIVMIRAEEKCVMYNFETESVQVVRYHGGLTGSGPLCPFYESSFLSSYVL